MRNTLIIRKLLISLLVTGLLLYFMSKSTGLKVIFIPFLICSVALACKNIAQLLSKENWAAVFHKLFVLGFVLFWTAFLAAACFISIRDKNYGLLLFSLPFWFIGVFLIKNKLLGKRHQASPFQFAFIVSAALVSIAVFAGLLLLVLGIHRREGGLLFAGAFFLLGSLTFLLGWLTVKGYFSKCKVDVLGLYMGFLLAAFGIGILIWKFTDLGLWILIPILMVIAGMIQIIRSLKSRK